MQTSQSIGSDPDQQPVSPPTRLLHALLLGVTRPQLRLFGQVIEQAGYQLTVAAALNAMPATKTPRHVDLLVCNRDMGETTILAAYRAMEPRPLLVILVDDQALPQAGFDQVVRQLCTPAMLHQHLRPAPADVPAPIAAAAVLPPPDAEPPPPPTMIEPLLLLPPPKPIEPLVLLPPPAAARYAAPALQPWWKRRLVATATMITLVLAAVVLLIQLGRSALNAGGKSPSQTIATLAATDPAVARVNPTQTEVPATPARPGATATATAAVAAEPTPAPMADLAVAIVAITPPQPVAGDVVNVLVDVRNYGTQDVVTPFWVDLYVAPRRTPSVNLAWDTISTYGSTWQITRLAAGETMRLETLTADPDRSNLLRFLATGQMQLYALVDSYGDSPDGAIGETNEQNNVSQPFTLTIREPANE